MGIVVALQSWLNMPVSASELMAKYALADDPRLLDKLYSQCGDDLYHYLLSMSNADTAMDIAQKTWLTVIEKRHLYQPTGRFESWLFTLGRHALIDELRKQQRLTSDDTLLHQLQAPPPVNTRPEVQFSEALTALPFAQREAFCLQQEGFGLQEIATICNSNRETIKTRLRYARQALKAALDTSHE